MTSKEWNALGQEGQIACAVNTPASSEAYMRELWVEIERLRAVVQTHYDSLQQLEAENARLLALLNKWVELFDGQTEPVPPVYWAQVLEATRADAPPPAAKRDAPSPYDIGAMRRATRKEREP